MRQGDTRSGYIAAIRRLVGGALVLVPSVTACIFDDHNRLLLLRHTDRDVWATPGGTIEPGESPADAVVRECHEELGVLVEPAAILGVFGGPGYEVRYGNGDRTAYVMTVFDCRVPSCWPRCTRQRRGEVPGYGSKTSLSGLATTTV
jgi:8-oxo-dGTP pyrophosphatase MutT (NUDIX family)